MNVNVTMHGYHADGRNDIWWSISVNFKQQAMAIGWQSGMLKQSGRLLVSETDKTTYTHAVPSKSTLEQVRVTSMIFQKLFQRYEIKWQKQESLGYGMDTSTCWWTFKTKGFSRATDSRGQLLIIYFLLTSLFYSKFSISHIVSTKPWTISMSQTLSALSYFHLIN